MTEAPLEWITAMKSLPPSLAPEVRAPIERLARELGYLKELLTIEHRQDEWPRILEIIQPFTADWEKGAWDRARDRVSEVENALAPWQSLAKSLSISYVGHAHMDMNWLWDWPETVEVVVNTLTTVDRLMDEFPDFRFSQSQTAVYDIVRRFDPGLFSRIGERVKQGRWEITANQWVEGDKNLASDESIVRHLLYSKKFFAEHWGISPDRVAIDFEPDTFGHPQGLPTVYRDAGVRWLYFCRGGPGDTAFRWQAPDGAEVLAWSDFQEWYNGTITGDEVGSLLKFYAESKVPHFLKVYGVGDHGGGPTRRDLKRLMEMRTWPIFPTLTPAFLEDHFLALERHREVLPRVAGELNYVFAGCYSSESDTKTMNAKSEADLRTAEGLQSMAGLLGVNLPTNQESLEAGWESTLFSQFHDILSGSGIPETYQYSLGRGQDVAATARIATQKAMASISQAIATKGLADPSEVVLVVFNPLAWERSDIVEMDVYERFEPDTALRLSDADGKRVPLQYRYDSHLGFPGHRRARLAFSATVPGLGYKVFILGAGSQELSGEAPAIEVANLGVGHQILTLSGQDAAQLGLVSTPERWHHERLPRKLRLFRQLGVSLYEQGFQVRTKTEAIAAHANQSHVVLTAGREKPALPLGGLEWFREAPNGMSAWEIGPDLEREAVKGTRWTISEVGPVRVRLRGQSTVKASQVVTWVDIYPDRKRIDWLVDIDWREFGGPETGIPGLSIAFSLPEFLSKSALFGQSCGSVERAIPSRDVPAQGWTAVLGKAGSAVVYHPTRYGISVSENAIRVTLLRASYHPDAYAEIGHHQVPLSFEWSDDAKPSPDQWTRTAMERLSRLTGWVGTEREGRLPTTVGALELRDRRGVVTAVKPAESPHPGLIVRMRQDQDADVALELSTSDRVRSAERISLLEEPTAEPIEWTETKVVVPVKAHGLATIRLQ